MTILVVAVATGLVGFAIGWLVRRGWTLGLTDGGNGHGHVTNIWNLPPGVSVPAWSVPADVATGGLPQALPRSDLGSRINHETRLMSMTIGAEPLLIFSAPDDRYYKIQLRMVSPPGSFALVASDPGNLRAVTLTSPNALVIPVGSSNEIRIKPRQRLYAASSIAGGVLSVVIYPEAL